MTDDEPWPCQLCQDASISFPSGDGSSRIKPHSLSRAPISSAPTVLKELAHTFFRPSVAVDKNDLSRGKKKLWKK